MLSVLAIVCPPAAVLVVGGPSRAMGNLGLTMLLYVPGMLNALSTVGRHNLERRYDAVMRALEARAA